MISTHRNPTTIHGKYDAKTIKLYISTVRKLKPMITVEAAELLRRFYGELREKDKGTQNTAYRVTVRQLESMIRLSEAYARLRMDTYVIPSDVKEAYQLISTSLMKLEKPPIELVGDFDEKYERELINKAILVLIFLISGKRSKKERKNKSKQKHFNLSRVLSVSQEEYFEFF
jgi:DNA replication licensing factor MCM6